jgi:nucleotide-binding universal stress UspA family protein
VADEQRATSPQAGFEIGCDGPSVVLAGVDGSPTSMHAASYAAGLARRQGSYLVLAYVARPPLYPPLEPYGAAAVVETIRDEGRELWRTLARETALSDVPVDFLVTHGDPYRELNRLADDFRADLLVVGASECARRRLRGSLAARLVRARRWPVVVVP